MMMNQVDEKLTRAGLKSRIVFLLYQELLWEPKRETVKNPDRFVLMFAPISRTYSTAYADAEIKKDEILEPYVRNHIAMPRSVSANVARLKKWQEKVKGCDSFVYDYHFMWAHYSDPGYMDISRVVFRDMENLGKLGLNGMISCQTLRAFFPSGIGQHLMAEALWNKNADFNHAAKEYFNAAYGHDGSLVMDYLKRLSELFDPPYIRHEKPQADPQKAGIFNSIGSFIDTFGKTICENLKEEKNPDPSLRYSWRLLQIHGGLCRILAGALAAKAGGEQKKAEDLFGDAIAFVRLHELEIHEAFDATIFINTLRRSITRKD
jgi:hypothetical protein